MMTEPLTVRKIADKEGVERVARYNPETGDKYLVDPSTGEPSPWPLLGVEIVGDLPKETFIPSKFVTRGQAEGWLEVVNPRMEHRPGGPPEDLWRVTHSFVHADAIVLQTINGPITYEITRQPDKYADHKGANDRTKVTPDAYRGGETKVDWFYGAKAVSGIVSKGRSVEASDFVFNRAKGRGTQWVELIIGNAAPFVNAQLVITLWRRGSQTDAAIKDFDDVATMEADAQMAELVSGTNANYVEKLINEATVTRTYDDTNEWVDIDHPDPVWTALGAGGTAITDYLVAFDNDSTSGTVRDAAVIPWTFHAFAVTPDGSDVTAVLPSGGFFRAT